MKNQKKKSENLSHLFQCYKKSEKIIEGFSEAIFKVFLSRMVRLGQVERDYLQNSFIRMVRLGQLKRGYFQEL